MFVLLWQVHHLQYRRSLSLFPRVASKDVGMLLIPETEVPCMRCSTQSVFFLWFTDNKLFHRAFKIWVKSDSCNMSDMLNLLKYKQKYLLSGSFRPQSEEQINTQVPSYPGGCEIGLVCVTVSRTVQKTTGCMSPNMVEEFRTGPV